MKAFTLTAVIAAAVTSFAAGAMAQEITPDNLLQPLHSSTTRAEVMAELQQAKQDGTIHAGDTGYMEPFHSTKSREQVKRETLAAIRDGEMAAINAESFDFVPPHAPAPASTRTASSQ